MYVWYLHYMKLMKNSVLIVLVIILGLVMVGPFIVNKLLWINYVEVSERQVENSSNEVSKLLLKNLCNSPQIIIADYPKGNSKVYECGDYYRIFPPENIADYPFTIVDVQGDVVAQCGGLPQPDNPTPDPLCSISCNKKDLCSGYLPW